MLSRPSQRWETELVFALLDNGEIQARGGSRPTRGDRRHMRCGFTNAQLECFTRETVDG